MKRIASITAAGLLVAGSMAGIAAVASADEPNYPPSIPPSLSETTAPAVAETTAPAVAETSTAATQVVGGVEQAEATLADTGAGSNSSLLVAAAGLVVVGGVAVTYARRRKGAHEA